MAKKYMTKEEEEEAVKEAKKFVEVLTLPDMIREAIRRNKWQPENYTVMLDDQMYSLEDALKHYESGEATETDMKVIKAVLTVPKIKRVIDRDFGGVISKAVKAKSEEVKKENGEAKRKREISFDDD